MSLPNGLASAPPSPPFPNGSSMNGSLVNGSVGVVVDCPPPLPPDAPPPLLKGSEPNRPAPAQDDYGMENGKKRLAYTLQIRTFHAFMIVCTCTRLPQPPASLRITVIVNYYIGEPQTPDGWPQVLTGVGSKWQKSQPAIYSSLYMYIRSQIELTLKVKTETSLCMAITLDHSW